MTRTFLHVGCGRQPKARTTRTFALPEWTELRLDIDRRVRPDIIGTMTDLSAVADKSMDAVFSSHTIEHLYPHEVPVALAEFRRVLRRKGFAVITCPDLQSVAALIAAGNLTKPAYHSPAGPIAPLDILFGYRPQLAAGNAYMAHHVGFTRSLLVAVLRAAGFSSVASKRRAHPHYDLWALATVAPVGARNLRQLAAAHFPK